MESELLILSFQISFDLPILLILNLCLHSCNQIIDIFILDLVFSHLHGILYHFVHKLHAFLLGGVGLHGVLKLFDVDLVLGAAHDFGHAVHHIRHLVHRHHRLQPECMEGYSNMVFCSCASRFLYFLMKVWFLRMF